MKSYVFGTAKGNEKGIVACRYYPIGQERKILHRFSEPLSYDEMVHKLIMVADFERPYRFYIKN